MRKLFSLFLALVATTSLWAHDFEVDDIYYNYLDGNNVEVTYRGDDYDSYDNEYSGEVIIPSTVTYNGTTYSVTSIGYEAFCGCSKLTAITIPNSVTSIGWVAFYGCSKLTSVTIPNSVTSIGYAAFSGCSSLTSITIPNSVTSIGDYAFLGCSSLTKTNYTGDIAGWCNIKFSYSYANPMYYSHNFYINDQEIKDLVIPNSIDSIHNYAFYNCSSLTSITIPNSVTSIGDYAFLGCSSLTSITIPNSVTSIGDYAFSSCSSLVSMVVESGNTKYDSRDNCNAIIETATNILIAGCQNTIIPNSVTSIGDYAFLGCSSLTSITIPNSVTSIGSQAFSGCSSLTSPLYNAHCFVYMPTSFKGAYVIPEGIKQIAGWAFFGCSSLSSVTIPNSVTSIGDAAFLYCLSLTSITIPNSVTSIGSSAFYECSSLASIICLGTTPPDASDLGANTSTCKLIVPHSAYNAYLRHAYWGQFLNIVAEDWFGENRDMTIIFTNSEDNDSEIYSQSLTLTIPAAPEIEGFTFLGWKATDEFISDVITIQAIYEANAPASAPEVYVNPANPAQKLLRNGQVYILKDDKTYTIIGQEIQ